MTNDTVKVETEEVYSIQLWCSECGAYLGMICGHNEDHIIKVVKDLKELDIWSVCYECQRKTTI